MGETDTHRSQIMDLIYGLQMHYLDDRDVYVSGNLLMFYEEGQARRYLSPDVLVALGVPRRERDHYLIWEEGKAPDFVIEVTSKSTRMEDLGVKKGVYALVGVREYFIFDPLREYLTPRLRGYRLEAEEYVPLIGDALRSEVLGLELRIVEQRLRLFDPVTQQFLPTPAETDEARRKAEEARHRAEEAQHRAEDENVRLREKLKQLRGQD